jgi:hypothetical protein
MPMEREPRPIQVAAAGMDERMRHAIRMFFQGPCKKRCVLVEEDLAEICLIDLDAYQGREIYDDYRARHPEQQIILLSLHDTRIEKEHFLRKPLNAKELIAALTKLRQTVEPATKPAIKTNRTAKS